MARLVPSLPRFGSAGAKKVGLALEAGLSDAFVVLQTAPGEPSALAVLHPDLGMAAIAVREGLHAWDGDAEAWLSPDGTMVGPTTAHAVVEASAGVLHDVVPNVPVTGLIAFADGIGGSEGKSFGSVIVGTNPAEWITLGQLDGPSSGGGGDGLLAEKVEAAMRAAAAEWRGGGDEWVTTAIRIVSPTASPYVRRRIPNSQARWRAQRLQESTPRRRIDKDRKDHTRERAILQLTRACIESALSGRAAKVAGIDLRAGDLADPAFLLPAIMIAAADDWTPVVASRDGRGGFLVRLAKDPEALLGYRVTGITPSAPLLLFVPVVNLVRRSVSGDECILDATVLRFARWLHENGLDDAVPKDTEIDVSIRE